MFSKYLVMDDWLNQARHLNPLVQDNSLWKESSNMLGSHLSLNMSHHDLSAGLSGEGERNVHAHTQNTYMTPHCGHANTPTSSPWPSFIHTASVNGWPNLASCVCRWWKVSQGGVCPHGMNPPVGKSEYKQGNEQGNWGSREALKHTSSFLHSEFLL